MLSHDPVLAAEVPRDVDLNVGRRVLEKSTNHQVWRSTRQPSQFAFDSIHEKVGGNSSMDGQKFDKLTRSLATGTNRRTLLKLFGGATVAGVAGVTLARSESAFAQEGTGCTLGTENPCGDNTLVCCATEESYGTPGGAGICTSGMTGCQASDECTSGTQDPCGYYNFIYDRDYICCTYGGDPGSTGTCVAESACVVKPPDTGAGTTSDTSSWIAPAAAIGAAAAVLAYKNRESKSENGA